MLGVEEVLNLKMEGVRKVQTFRRGSIFHSKCNFLQFQNMLPCKYNGIWASGGGQKVSTGKTGVTTVLSKERNPPI